MKTIVQRMTAQELRSVKTLCSVCRGISPASDEHDMNPPCIVTAWNEIYTRALAWDILNQTVRMVQ